MANHKFKMYKEIEQEYSDNTKEKIICTCGYKYSKYLSQCPNCYGKRKENLRNGEIKKVTKPDEQSKIN